MKPTIQYRPAAPKKAAPAVVNHPNGKPIEKPEAGKWVWVRDDQMITKRSKAKSKAYMRKYMREYRKRTYPNGQA